MYVVYLTVYGGNKMPNLYIGSSSLESIFNGYRGSVSSIEYRDIWKSELKHNFNLFGSFVLEEFPTRELALEAERKWQIKYDVIKNPLFINKGIGPAVNPKWINVKESLNPFYGRKHSLKSKTKMSNSKIGNKNPMYGRTGHKCPNGRLLGEQNPFYGKEHSKETLDSIRNTRNSKNPLWNFKDALYELWLKYNKPNPSQCRKIFEKIGYANYDCRSVHAYFIRKEGMK